jgi:hypothetical protein
MKNADEILLFYGKAGNLPDAYCLAVAKAFRHGLGIPDPKIEAPPIVAAPVVQAPIVPDGGNGKPVVEPVVTPVTVPTPDVEALPKVEPVVEPAKN